MTSKGEKYLKVGFINVGSLGTGHDDLISALDRQRVDIMAINETWLRPGEEGRAPVVPGYRLRHTPRPASVRAGRGGGVGFYVKRGLSARACPRVVDPRFESVEQMWLTLSMNGKKIAIGTAYRPPWFDLSLFLDAVTDSVSSLGNCDGYILMGDFNVNLLDVNGSKTRNIHEFLNCLSLTQLVTSPTHFTATSETLIDLICSDLRARYTAVESLGSLHGHSIVLCEFNIKCEKFKPLIVKYRPLRDICMDKFKTDLSQLNLQIVSELGDVNDMVRAFRTNIIFLFDVHAPVRTCTIKERSYPWITDTIKFMMRLRNKALSSYRKMRTDSKKKYYNELKQLVNSSLYNEKVAYFKQNVNNKIQNPKLLWKNLKSTVLPFNSRQEIPPQFNDPDLINRNFLTVPGNPIPSPTHILFYETHKHDAAVFKIAPVEQTDVSRTISGLKSNAKGYDDITLDMIVMTLPHTLNVITSIINCSIVTSTFPDQWKIASIKPLPKNANPSTLKDLRPISILPCLSKVLEKIVSRQLSLFLEQNKILPDLQSGFRRQRSTSTALLDVTDNILWAQDRGMCTFLVLLDFSRAFDAINIPLLLAKLNYYGFDPSAIEWFRSYLSNREQLVDLRLNDGTSLRSERISVERGVPQGSILGPIIFTLYCADIVKCLQKCNYHIYADDVQLYVSFRPNECDRAIKDLNEDLERIAEWSESNCLSLNPTKTKYLVFGTRQQLAQLPVTFDVRLMGEQIERVNEARNLGLTMDKDLRFEKHVADCVRNCFYRLRVLYRIRCYLSESLREQLVEALVLSRLNYADVVYGPRLLARTDRLVQRVQNACARFCYNIPYRSHVTPYLNGHFVLKMKSRRKLHLACLLFNVIRHKQPNYLYSRLSWMASGRECGRRQCFQQLSTHPHKTAAFRGSFRYAASKIWNNLPPPIRLTNTIHTFKKQLRQYLVDTQRKLDIAVLNDSII